VILVEYFPAVENLYRNYFIALALADSYRLSRGVLGSLRYVVSLSSL